MFRNILAVIGGCVVVVLVLTGFYELGQATCPPVQCCTQPRVQATPKPVPAGTKSTQPARTGIRKPAPKADPDDLLLADRRLDP
jgi:hypothetical protein